MPEATKAARAKAMALHKQTFNGMNEERVSWFLLWRELADYFSPRRYPWLQSQREQRTANQRNRKLLDSTSSVAIRTLSSGMMDGITSPARPWFRLRIPGFEEEALTHASQVWLQEVQKRIFLLLAESNFYNAIAGLYFNWSLFGTGAMMIYRDEGTVFRFFNYAVGEFFLAQDNKLLVNRLARRYTWKVNQVVQEFGIDNVTENTKTLFKNGGANRFANVDMRHIVEPNDPSDGLLSTDAPFREVYYEAGASDGNYAAIRPFFSWPVVAPRWDVYGNDSYGTSPAVEALPDVQQLQELWREKTVGLAKEISPPLIVDQQLRNRPTALHANGITYASTANGNFGAKEAYKTKVPHQEISQDILDLRERIRQTCFNDLFNMFNQMDKVRSATEIIERREEILVHLGPVYQRFEGEVLAPVLTRVFAIMQENGLLPPAPEELDEQSISVQYISVLSDAQRAVGSVAIERFLGFTAEVGGVYPDVLAVANPTELVREYAESIGVKPSGINSRARTAEILAEQAQAEQAQQAAELGKTISEGAVNLSNTDVGGGQNALSALVG